MTKTPWTPGPWALSPAEDAGPAQDVIGGGDYYIATCWGLYAEADADARLIAAAPEMAELLREVVDNPDKANEDLWWRKARAALAEARGET